MQRVEHLLPAMLGFALVFREGFAGAWLGPEGLHIMWGDRTRNQRLGHWGL